MREHWWLGFVGWAVLSLISAGLSPSVIQSNWRSEKTRLGKVVSSLGYTISMAAFAMFATSFLIVISASYFRIWFGYMTAVWIADRFAKSIGYFSGKQREETYTLNKQ